MAKMTLKDISKKMRKINLCMMTTITEKGMTASRPMSNNRDVEYDGNSFFFTFEKSRLIKDLSLNDHVSMSFSAPKRFFISVSGRAKVIRSKKAMEEHWVKGLEKWFEDGLDTPGIAMIQVRASRIKYWHKEEEGEVKV